MPPLSLKFSLPCHCRTVSLPAATNASSEQVRGFVVKEFYVDLDGLDELAQALDNATSDVCQVTGRIANKADVDLRSGGLINTLRGGVEHTYVWGQQHARRISELLGDAAAAVRSARRLYAGTDERSSRRFDAFFADPSAQAALANRPPPRIGALFESPDGGGVDWYGLARRHRLEGPQDFAYKYSRLTDALSVSGNVRGIALKLFKKDIFEFFIQGTSGNWDGLWAAGAEFTSCGSALASIGRDVVACGNDLPAVWRGYAADACHAYLLQLGGAIEATEALYHDVGNQYRNAAELAWAQFDRAGAALDCELDKLVEIVFAVASGTVTIETIFGGIIGYGVAGWMLEQAFDLYADATKFWAKAITIVNATQASLVNVLGGGGPHAWVAALPEAPYRFHPTKVRRSQPSYPKAQPVVMHRVPTAELIEHARYGLLRSVKLSAEDELVREIADAVLAGHVTWSEALHGSVYSEALTAFLDKVNVDHHSLSNEMLKQCKDEARAFEYRLAGEYGIVNNPDVTEPFRINGDSRWEGIQLNES